MPKDHSLLWVISGTVYHIQNNLSPRRQYIIHYNRLKSYFPNFSKEKLGSIPASAQPESAL